MWGAFVESAGVGPKACPVTKLTAEQLAQALQDLASPTLQAKAAQLSQKMACEDGIQGGFVHFMDCLPRENMLCDVSLLLGESVLARYELVGSNLRSNGIKVSSEAAALLELDNKFDLKSIFRWCPTKKLISARQIWALDMRRHSVTTYRLSGHIDSFFHGLFAAFGGLIFGVFRSALQVYWKADQWARSNGAFGCLFGLFISAFYIVAVALLTILIFFDRLGVGIANGCFGKHFNYLFDPSWKAKVHNTSLIMAEKEKFLTHGIPKARRSELHEAMKMVVKARVLFQECNPYYPGMHQHYVVVKLTVLTKTLRSDESQKKLRLQPEEIDTVIRRLDKNSLPTPQSVRRLTFFQCQQASSDAIIECPVPQTIIEDEEEAPDVFIESHRTSSFGASLSKRPKTEKAPSSGFLSDIMNPLNFLKKKGAEETEISFSQFIQALQAVSKDKYQHVSRRRGGFSSNLDSDRLEDFSEYFH